MESIITIFELRELCDLTLQLTKLRQNECKHLCVENTAPDILRKLLDELRNHKRGFDHYSCEHPEFNEDLTSTHRTHTVEPGSERHLTLMMAKYNLNFVTGKDRQDLLAWGRDVWDAAKADNVS